jgi:predicted nucleotidyltransferase
MAKSFPKKIKKILAETKGQLSSLYAHRLKEVILFGSYARGDYTRGSDIRKTPLILNARREGMRI